MMRSLVGLGALVGLAACTHNRPIQDVYEVAGKEVTVETYDGASIEVTAEQASATDGLVYRSGAAYLPVPNVARVVEIRRGRGALEGLGIGFLIGFVGGAVLGFADGDDECNPDDGSWCILTFTAEEKAMFAGTLLGGLGGSIGLVVGLLRGSHYVYSFGEQSRVIPTGPPGSTLGMTITF